MRLSTLTTTLLIYAARPAQANISTVELLKQYAQNVRANQSGGLRNKGIIDHLPCILTKEGCPPPAASAELPMQVKISEEESPTLQRTNSLIHEAVANLQQKLEAETNEIVMELQRRAAELQRRIAVEAEQIGEAIFYLVGTLSDSVAAADQAGVGFVRQWLDEAERNYIGSSPDEFKSKVGAELVTKLQASPTIEKTIQPNEVLIPKTPTGPIFTPSSTTQPVAPAVPKKDCDDGAVQKIVPAKRSMVI